MNDQIKFRRTIRNVGGSSAVTIPKELLDFIGLVDNQDVFMTADSDKLGKYMAIRKVEEKQE